MHLLVAMSYIETAMPAYGTGTLTTQIRIRVTTCATRTLGAGNSFLIGSSFFFCVLTDKYYDVP